MYAVEHGVLGSVYEDVFFVITYLCTAPFIVERRVDQWTHWVGWNPLAIVVHATSWDARITLSYGFGWAVFTFIKI